jgi:hypothetical protein
MANLSIFTGECCPFLTPKQLKSLRQACVEGPVIDKSCSRESINTCGVSIEELFDTYPIYNPQKGLYKSWGDIEFPWEIGDLTPNLLRSQTDDKWKVATYRAIVAYPVGSRVLYIEDDGYRVSLYEANQDILAMSWAFDYSKWDKICQIETTIPVGIPSISELLERFELYGLRLFDKEWGQYDAEWDEPLKETTLANCTAQGLSFIDFEKCVRNLSSDEWDKARIRRDFFYREGDMFIAYGPCEDTLCLYIVTEDLPATLENLEKYKKFNSRASFWQKFYCVNTDRNKCLEYQRYKEPFEGYDVIEIGSQGHYVEAPKPYSLNPSIEDLSIKSSKSLEDPPKVLTPRELDVLDGTLPPECLR